MIRRIIYTFAMLFAFTAAAHATTLTLTQGLSFGNFFFRNNNAVYSATLSPLGALSSDNAFVYMTTSHHNAVYSITGGTPDVDINVSFNPTTVLLTCGCGSPDLTLENFIISPLVPHLSLAGSTTFKMGATLRTSGNGAIYQNGAYTGSVNVYLDY